MLRYPLSRLLRFTHAPYRTITYQCNQKELNFVLNDVLQIQKIYDSELTSKDTINSLIQECAKFSENELLPIRQDPQTKTEATCKFNTATNSVITPHGWKDAFKLYCANGWQGLSVPEQYGGQGFPAVISLLRSEITGTASWAWSMYSGLTSGATNTLLIHGNQAQKDIYVKKMANGEWTGTMCLTESHCGSDLGQITTSAVADGTDKLGETYKLNGTKIFISCGDHDFTENIIHIVLARLPDVPKGTKGISLFLVPKYVMNHEGSLQSKQNIQCTRIENKMGIHGSSTCEIVLDNSIGYLIGEPNTGLKQMFTFMNIARLGTGLQGLTTMELTYQNTVPYAKERLAFRALSGTKYPDEVADPLIVHGDIRRMLLTMRSILEPARAWLYNTSMIGDQWWDQLNQGNNAKAEQLDSELGLQTPILKGFLTEMCQEVASSAIQIWGGHGYITDNGIEQIYRDARISTLYEGTTEIQGLDLLGRKVMLDRAKLLNTYISRISRYCRMMVLHNSETRAKLFPMIGIVQSYAWQWRAYTYLMMAKASQNRDLVGTSSYDYLMFSGYVNVAYWWLRMLEASTRAESVEKFQRRFKLARFYFDRVLPRAGLHASLMKRSPQSVMSLADSEF